MTRFDADPSSSPPLLSPTAEFNDRSLLPNDAITLVPASLHVECSIVGGKTRKPSRDGRVDERP